MPAKILEKKTIQLCQRCIIDETVPGHNFDQNGRCAFCRLHDHLEKECPLNEQGETIFNQILKKVRKNGQRNKYDCVVGISGGRDSVYTLYMCKKVWGLRPLAVHFNDGFGNPIAGENMKRATQKIGVELRTITSDWRESKDIRIAYLRASTPDLGTATDIGIAGALYSVALKEKLKYIIIGQSFRTEGIAPLEWNYLDGKYLQTVHKLFGKYPIRPWRPLDPGFNLSLWSIFYYAFLKQIKTIPILYYQNYVRHDAEEIIKKELGWVYPGAHYYDDLYQSLLWYVMRTKFNIDRRRYNYSALIRSGQMNREEALERMEEIYVIEDPKVIDLCIKRLGLTRLEFEEYVKRPPKTFRDYDNNLRLIQYLKPIIWLCSQLHILPKSAYFKYFECG